MILGASATATTVAASSTLLTVFLATAVASGLCVGVQPPGAVSITLSVFVSGSVFTCLRVVAGWDELFILLSAPWCVSEDGKDHQA